ncbi:MAG: SusC/RagA family TonB-linked outer membrane protein, partial [Bacteroidota bacterium]|nr:SusC/RagA family TonB-linked outer membrane protein [Bacteroidota bacterium]
MKKILLFNFLFMTMLLNVAWAQDRAISGRVISEDDGSPLPGVNVIVQGTTTGTTTDVDGAYRLILPSGANTLVFTFIGFATQEVNVGTRSVVDVSLASDVRQLGEVVVTAIGIERERKALGYAVSVIGEDLIANRPEADVTRTLQGKVAGVNITSTGGVSGTGTNIIIRGYSSVTGGNQPLFVVDGVPFNSGTNQQGSFQEGGVTTTSRFLDIDPNNIESVSVLKGLSATVLYGDQGRNGVILITTKSGASKRRPTEININQSVFANRIASLPNYQDNYGGGFQQNVGFFYSNWGPHFNDVETVAHPIASSGLAKITNAFPEYFEADGVTPIRYDYRAYDDPGKSFFRTGMIYNTSVQLSGSSDRAGFNASFGYTDEEGFTPGNELRKYNFGLGLNAQILKGMTVNSSFTFAITDMKTPPINTGFGSGPALGIPSVFSNVLYTPRSVDLGELPFENPNDRSSVYYRGGNDITNPLWLVKYYSNTSETNRFFNATALNYDFNENFSVTYRIGLDTYHETQEVMLNKGGTGSSIPVVNGSYRTVNINNSIWNQDLILNWKQRFSDRLGMSALIGGNTRYDVYEQNGIASVGQIAFGLFRHDNFESSSTRNPYYGGAGTAPSLNFTEEQRRMGVYAQVTLDYSDFLFLNLSARNDWTSTVEPENRRILYPGASVSFLPTTAFGLQSDAINDLKLRLGYGTSAGFPNPYNTRSVLTQNARAFSNEAGTIFPTHSLSTFLGNENLKPELHEEIEFGVEAVMFNNRLTFDFSAYQKNTNNLITQTPIDPSTGFLNTTINIGKIRNRGIEFAATVTPVTTPGGFSWESTLNYGMYRSIVMELGGGLDEVVIAGYTNLGNFAIPGQPFNIIQGTGILRDDEGRKIVLPNGQYAATSELAVLGDPNPAFTSSWINNFSFRGFNLSAMMEYRHKGVIVSNTVRGVLARGISRDTEMDRSQTFILPGVKEDGTPNDIQVTAANYFFDNYFFTDEAITFDGSTIRLREVALSYS